MGVGAALVPIIGQDEVRSPAVSTLVGNGRGRGWAVLMLTAGVLAALVVLRSLRLRRVQDDLPDVTPEDRLAPAAPGASMPVGVTAPPRLLR
jgi:hypothetical protein